MEHYQIKKMVVYHLFFQQLVNQVSFIFIYLGQFKSSKGDSQIH